MRRLILWPVISQRIGRCGLSHDSLLRFLNGLRTDLESHYDIYKVVRDDEEPGFFRYFAAIVDGETIHQFEFVIDDSTSPDHLFVEDLEHHSIRE